MSTLHMNNALPDLHIPYPQCGHCGEDVEIEDGLAWCNGCRIEWGDISDGATATPDRNREGTDVTCGVVAGSQDQPHDDKRGNHYVPGPPLPCILPSGHEDAQHLCPYDVEVTRHDMTEQGAEATA